MQSRRVRGSCYELEVAASGICPGAAVKHLHSTAGQHDCPCRHTVMGDLPSPLMPRGVRCCQRASTHECMHSSMCVSSVRSRRLHAAQAARAE